MKVKYAAQTQPPFVNAISYLKDANLANFKDCEATITFIETIDWLFDILNSRNPFDKGYKQPPSRSR